MGADSWETDRTRVRRKPERAAYDRAAVYPIIDEAIWCHVGVVRDGQPVVIPTVHARVDDEIYLHGSPSAGILRDARSGLPVCITFTHIDGLVLSRSARNHSLNYRSAVVFGTGTRVRDHDDKLRMLEVIVNHVVPGRWDEVRQPTQAELREVDVVSVAITEASAKSRSGPPLVDETDGECEAWAGAIPLVTTRGEPEPSSFVPAEVPAPRW